MKKPTKCVVKPIKSIKALLSQTGGYLLHQLLANHMDNVQRNQKRPEDAEPDFLPCWLLPFVNDAEIGNKDANKPDGCNNVPHNQ